LKELTFTVIDFETTGFSPETGDRAIEVAAIQIKSGKIVSQYQSLIRTGEAIPYDIQRITGITNDMTDSAPEAKAIMKKLAKFIGTSTVVAHNVSFDRRFLNNEFYLAGIDKTVDYICTLLLSRRLYQDISDYKLTTIAAHHNIEWGGNAHRAMADAMVTAKLFIIIKSDLWLHKFLMSSHPRKILEKIKIRPRTSEILIKVVPKRSRIYNLFTTPFLVQLGPDEIIRYQKLPRDTFYYTSRNLDIMKHDNEKIGCGRDFLNEMLE